MRYSIVVPGLLAQVIGAVKPPLPAPTDALLGVDPRGVSPRPTDAPVPHYGLMRRSPLAAASSGSLIGWVAPDNTCGYVDGSIGAIKTCYSTDSCAAVQLSSFAVMACCDAAAAQCTALGECINYAEYWTSSACNQVCQQDYNTIKCTNSLLPYCYSYLIPSMSAIGFQCASTFSSGFGTIETTFGGENDGRTWTPLYDTSSGASSIFNGFSTVQTSSFAGISTLPAPVSSAATTSSAAAQKSSSNAGPIAGGVVGGLIVIGAAAIGIAFLLRRRGGSGSDPGAPGNGQYSEPMAAAAAVPPAAAFAGGDPRYSTASYYKPPEGPGLQSPASYTGSPPPTYGVPGGVPQEMQYNPAQQQQYAPPQQVYSPQPYAQQQQQAPQPAVSPVQQGVAPVQSPWGPPPPQGQQPQQQYREVQQPTAHELGGGSAYPVPMTTAEGQPIYEAAGGQP